MKRMRKILALALAALTAAALCACGGNTASRLEHNVARFYSRDTRESRFTIDGKLVDGSVRGVAYMETSARGDTSLAWVDTALYFVSEKGVDALGTGIGTAEISFDGQLALFLEGDELKCYRLEDRSISALDTGISAVIQFAISPESKSIVFTAVYGEEETPRAMLYKDGELTRLFADRSVVVLAVSDDAGLIWYYDSDEASFCAQENGETVTVSKDCAAGTNFNFTNDLKEVEYDTADGVNRLFRLASKKETELGEGFDITLKTDVYSISTVTLFTYINDADTFTNGLWQKRVRYDGGAVYSVGHIDNNGEITWLAENASKCEAAPDGSRVIWLKGGQLYSTDLKGNNTLLSSDADGFALTGDGSETYFVSNGVIYYVRGTGKASRFDTDVSEIKMLGNVCVYLKQDGRLMAAEKGVGKEVMSGAARLDQRAGQLIVYTDPVEADGEKLYRAYVTADGRSFGQVGENIRP